MNKPERRYVEVHFVGCLPADLAVQCHKVMKGAKINECGPTAEQHGYYEGEYDDISAKNGNSQGDSK